MKITKIASILLLLTMFTWGCNSGGQESSANEQVQQKEQVTTTKQQANPAGEADQYGRKSGDAHYGHNHSSSEPHSAPKTNAQPASGEPDKFGRKPGDPHYGHNHE